MTINIIENKNSDQIDALAIRNKGWRQGSIFDPRGILEDIRLSEGELLVICTHSCTVVSARFLNDPVVEAMVIKPLEKYNPKCFEATGKNQRKLHIELLKNPIFKCIECNINQRFFFGRRKLLEFSPSQEHAIGTEGTLKLAAWLARAYTRISLPDLLVERMKVDIFPSIFQCLDQKHPENQSAAVHEAVPYIYLDWQPREDVSDIFDLKFLFVCFDLDTENVLDAELVKRLRSYQTETGKNGIKISSLDIGLLEDTLMIETYGYERLSEWDFLSEFGEIAAAPPRFEALLQNVLKE